MSALPKTRLSPALTQRPFNESSFLPRRQPFFYLLSALLAGILIDRWIAPARWAAVCLAVASLIFSLKFLLSRKDRQTTILILIGFVAAGAFLSSAERAEVKDSRLKRLFDARAITPDEPVELSGVLIAPPEPAPGARYLEIEAESVTARAQSMSATGRARLMIALSDEEMSGEFFELGLEYGSRVRVLVRLERARVYKNPGSPDFDEFLERQGYDLRGIIKSPLLIERAGNAAVCPLLAALYRARLRAMSAIDASFAPRVAGTLKAILIGNRNFLDGRVSERLREAATFHVLSISGMHISLIAWALLGGRSKLKRRPATRVIFSLLILWAYAAMVGLAPPVTRATVMITLALFGPLLFRRAVSVNTVALAAFVMLALKPSLVADPGFHLSFIAVAAIVMIALPLADRLRSVGDWRPAPRTPHPPACSRATRLLAEILFWDERRFKKEMRRAPVRYRLDKSRAARALNRLRVQRLMRGAALLALTSASIQLCTLPLMVFYFNRVAPVGVLLNVAAGMLTGLLMFAASMTIAFGSMASWAGAQFEAITTAAHYLLVNAALPFLKMPGATFRAAHYEGWGAIIYVAYFVPVALLIWLIDRWRPVDEMTATRQEQRTNERESIEAVATSRALFSFRSGRWLCATALLAFVIAVIRPAPVSPSGKLEIHFLDVGQGDSALVIFPKGTTMLIDSGGEINFNRMTKRSKISETTSSGEVDQADTEDSELNFKDSSLSVGEAVVSRFLWSLGLTRIDYAVVTHADADHIGGLSYVLQNFRVGEVLVGSVPASAPEFEKLAETALRRGVPMGIVTAGDRFEIEGVTIEVLWPGLASRLSASSNNNDSVVLRLVYASVGVLFAADIEQAAEAEIVRSGVDLRADLLKVPHHGSRTSSTEPFIDAVRPQCAVISVGERSRFGHPHAVVVNRYIARGVSLFQTGRQGTINAQIDGAGFTVKTYDASNQITASDDR